MQRILILFWLGWGLIGIVGAQEFPSRPIMIVMPFSAGGPADIVARTLAQSISKVRDQQFIVENTIGAGSTLGAGRVAGSPPDGYSLLLTHISRQRRVLSEFTLRPGEGF